MSGFEQIEKAVLELPAKERVWLAESLVASLAPVAEDLAEAAEIAEAERRESEIASGRTQPLSETDLWQRVKAHRPR